MQHIYLAVRPSPTHGTAYHLHFIQGMVTKGYSTSRTYTAVVQRPDSFDGEFGIPLPSGAAPFRGSPRSQLSPCPEGSPGGDQLVLLARSPSPLASWAPPRYLARSASWPPSVSPRASRAEGPREAASRRPRGKETKENVRELSIATGKCHGRSARFGGITETVPDLEAVGSRGPKAAYERNSPLTRTCMTVPDCLKILGDNSAFA